MSYRKSSLIALRALQRNRLQTVLTTIGMSIGVGTVLAVIAVGSGAQRSIQSQVRAAGMNVILVSSGNHKQAQQWTNMGEADDPPPPNGPPPPINPEEIMKLGPENLGGTGVAHTLSLGDAAQIATLPGVQAVSGSVHENMLVSAGSSTWIPQVRGEQAALPQIRRAWIFPHGRFFAADEEAHNASVAVVGSVAAAGLFGARNPVGETISIKGKDFRVIGTIASSSWMVPAAAGDGQFDAVYLPIGTAFGLFGRDYLDTIAVSTLSPGDVTRLTKAIFETLRQRHHLRNTMPSDFTVASQADAAIAKGGMRTDFTRAMASNTASLDHVTLAQLSQTLDHASRTMTVLLGSIGAVSLIVGGIGIMNIMLLSVTERTREIGIRRAVGARSIEVMRQFLLEAVILSVAGGLLGIALGAAGAVAIGRSLHWATDLSWIAVLVAFSVSAAIGILFGYYPAREAAQVTPMDALRYE